MRTSVLGHNRKQNKNQCGFSMLEILITLVIIATALLGTAGLQLYAMKVGKSGEFRTQAVFLVSELAERMEANKLGAVGGDYAVATASAVTAAATDCSANACDAPTLASWDISQWESAVVALQLPQATWAVTQTTAGNPSTYKIEISWVDRSPNKAAHSETSTYTANRTISD